VARHDDRIAVNARELWEKLEVKTKFADWIKRRIEMYTFAENTEWISISKVIPTSENNSGTGGRPEIDYFISLDMARELSMVENNAQVLISLNSCQA
jgi:phage anti-repressor protein